MTFDRRWEDNPAHDTYYPKSGDKKVAYTEGVFVGYRGYDKSGREAAVSVWVRSFLHDFRLQESDCFAGVGLRQPVEVHFDVTNTGSRAGAEVAEVYVGDRHSSVPRPAKELKGFVQSQPRTGRDQASLP